MAEIDPIIGQEQIKIVEFLQKCNNGVTDKVLKKNFPDLDPKIMVQIINSLLGLGLLELFKSANNSLIYKYNPKDANANNDNLEDSQERLVFQIIKESGNKGIWIRDIRYKSNLLLAQLNKILKSMEGRKLVKSVKSVAASKKKVYMLYDLEPDQTLTGGAWYSDQDFESEFVDILNSQCLKFLKSQAESKSIANSSISNPRLDTVCLYTPLEEIKEYITQLGISKVALSLDDIEMIMSTLIYDNEVEQITVPTKSLKTRCKNLPSTSEISSNSVAVTKLYRVLESAFPPSASGTIVKGEMMEIDEESNLKSCEPRSDLDDFTVVVGMASKALISVPSAFCPIYDVGVPDIDTNAQSSSYYEEWLKN